MHSFSFNKKRACYSICSRYTRWFKYDRDYLCVNKSRFVPVIFIPPCIKTHIKCNLVPRQVYGNHIKKSKWNENKLLDTNSGISVFFPFFTSDAWPLTLEKKRIESVWELNAEENTCINTR